MAEIEHSDAVVDEVRMYERLACFSIASDKRRADFKAHMEKLAKEFEDEECLLKMDRTHYFLRTVLDRGIEAVRWDIVPAYTFEGFPKLPKELQLRIWSLAARLEKEREYMILPSEYLGHMPSADGCDHLSRVLVSLKSREERACLCPNILLVCRDSRAAALQVYQLMACRVDFVNDFHHDRLAYVNILYGQFRMFSAGHYLDFGILDHMQSQYTLRSQAGESLDIDRHLSNLPVTKIRHLMVDVSIFIQSHLAVWSQFTNLEVLTIGFYPFTEESFIDGHLVTELGMKTKFFKPDPNTTFGHRAAWLCREVNRLLQTVPALEQSQVRPHSLRVEAIVIEPEQTGISSIAYSPRYQNKIIDESTEMTKLAPLRRRMMPLSEVIKGDPIEVPAHDIKWYENSEIHDMTL